MKSLSLQAQDSVDVLLSLLPLRSLFLFLPHSSFHFLFYRFPSDPPSRSPLYPFSAAVACNGEHIESGLA